jgi:hypothetical protein
MAQLSATRCSCITILWVSLVSFAAITRCVASQRVFIVVVVYFVISTQFGNFWIHPHICVWKVVTKMTSMAIDWFFGYLMMFFRLKQLHNTEWDLKMIMNDKQVRTWKECMWPILWIPAFAPRKSQTRSVPISVSPTDIYIITCPRFC